MMSHVAFVAGQDTLSGHYFGLLQGGTLIFVALQVSPTFRRYYLDDNLDVGCFLAKGESSNKF